jgi:hypothetical protein
LLTSILNERKFVFWHDEVRGADHEANIGGNRIGCFRPRAGGGLCMRIRRRLLGICGTACADGVDTGPSREQGPSAYNCASAYAKGGEADGRQGETPRNRAEARRGDE